MCEIKIYNARKTEMRVFPREETHPRFIEEFRNSNPDIILHRHARHLPQIVRNPNFLEIRTNILNFNKEFYWRTSFLATIRGATTTTTDDVFATRSDT